MSQPMTHLPEALIEFMQAPRLVQLTTVDTETGGPFVNIISWALALSPGVIRLMGHGKSRFIQNVKQDPRVALTILGAGSAWTIYGRGRVRSDAIPAGSMSWTLVDVTDLQVHSALFLGAVLTQEPAWEVPSSRGEAERLDAALFAAMRSWQG